MKTIRAKLPIWLAPLAILASVASLTLAQNETGLSDSEKLQKLISDRRAQLEKRLERLRATEESFGENHPSAERFRMQIADTEKEMQTLEQRASLLEFDDKDLRVLILTLALQVDRLENEVEALKQRIPRRTGGSRALGRGVPPR